MTMQRRTVLKLLVGTALLPLCGCRQTQNTQSDQTAQIDTGTQLDLYCFAAGKADALLLTTAGSAVLVDTGEKGFGKTIVAYLQEQNIQALDYLVVTHFDKDHVGGAAKVLRAVTVRQVLQSNCPKESDEYTNYRQALQQSGAQVTTVRTAMEFALDGVQYRIDPPAQESYAKDASNNSSLIVAVQNGANRLLFLGDAEKDRLAEFLPRITAPYDLVKLPHHGRWEDNLPDVLQAAAPRYAVITSSDEMLEDTTTTDFLAQQGIETLLTRTGAVSAVSDGDTLTAGYVP